MRSSSRSSRETVPLALAAAVLASAPGAAQCVVEQKVAPPTLGAGDYYGQFAVADEERLAVSDQTTDTIHVFHRTGVTWGHVQSVDPVDQLGGWAQSFDLDGDTLAIATPFVRRVRIHTWTGGAWTETQVLDGDPWVPAPLRFGTTAVVAGARMAVSATASGTPGRLYTFALDGGLWRYESEVLLDPAQYGTLLTVPIGLDGDTLVARCGSGADTLAVLAWDGSAWQVQALFSDGYYQTELDLDGDLVAARVGGDTLLYRRTGTNWSLDAALSTIHPTFLGGPLSLNGARLAVGAPSEDVGRFVDAGKVYVFERGVAGWFPSGELAASDAAAFDEYGDAVALSGTTLLVTAPKGDDAGLNSGTAYATDLAPAPALHCTGKTTSEGCVPGIGWDGSPTLSGADDFVLLSRGAPVGVPGVFVSSTNGPAATPFGGGTLCVQAPLWSSPPLYSAGSGPCGGGFWLPFDQEVMADQGLTSGSRVDAQLWFRDPAHPDGTGVGLSDAVGFPICP